jgi:hypothetical protein
MGIPKEQGCVRLLLLVATLRDRAVSVPG